MINRTGNKKAYFETTKVCVRSIGVITMDKNTGRRDNTVLIAKGTKLPADAILPFKTIVNNQREIRLYLTEGEASDGADAVVVSDVKIELPEGLLQGTKGSICLQMDETKGILIRISIPSAGYEHEFGEGSGIFDGDKKTLENVISEYSVSEADYSRILRGRSEKNERRKMRNDRDRISPIVENALSDVVGMNELKKSLNDILNMMQTGRRREGFDAVLRNNICILGRDGSGKTTAALAAARAFKAMGITGAEAPVKADYYAIVSAVSEKTHENIQKLFENAEDTCILLENIHEFDDENTYGRGIEAIDMFCKAYEVSGGHIPVIVTGREAETEALLQKKRRFGDIFDIPAVKICKYTIDELVQIACRIAETKNLIIDDRARAVLRDRLEHISKRPDFEGARDIDEMINEAYIRQVGRISKKRRPGESDLFLLKSEDFGETEADEGIERFLEELDGMIGLSGVKRQVKTIVNQVMVKKMRAEAGISSEHGYGSLHMVFSGNPGTGKTTVARIIGRIYEKLGVLPSGRLVECNRADLVSQFVGGTAQKVEEKVREAMGGILFIDEAYALCKDDNDIFGREAVDALVANMENHRDCLMIILAGYTADMEKFLDRNQGLRSRVPTSIIFADYSLEEMVQIFKKNIKDNGLVIDGNLDDSIRSLLHEEAMKKDFGNARGVRNVFEAVMRNQSNRLGMLGAAAIGRNDFVIIKKEDIDISSKSCDGKSVDDYLDELEGMTGLASVKERVNCIVDTVRVNKLMAQKGLLKQGIGTLHMVFKGNAGTGKTTVARLVGNIYRELGVLSTGQLIECDRSHLVAGYTGQTALKVKEKVREAMGGILFIDEAYSLTGDTFGQEAIDTLVADIENYRENLMVIIAGYPENMDHFLRQNLGLKSRFPNEIVFEDYSADEMIGILIGMLGSRGYKFADDVDRLISEVVREASAAPDFGNARGVRNLADRIIEKHNRNMAKIIRSGKEPEDNELLTISAADIDTI